MNLIGRSGQPYAWASENAASAYSAMSSGRSTMLIWTGLRIAVLTYMERSGMRELSAGTSSPIALRSI